LEIGNWKLEIFEIRSLVISIFQFLISSCWPNVRGLLAAMLAIFEENPAKVGQKRREAEKPQTCQDKAATKKPPV
jgi:hypothetical protein